MNLDKHPQPFDTVGGEIVYGNCTDGDLNHWHIQYDALAHEHGRFYGSPSSWLMAFNDSHRVTARGRCDMMRIGSRGIYEQRHAEH
jgi:hypothetical protein